MNTDYLWVEYVKCKKGQLLVGILHPFVHEIFLRQSVNYGSSGEGDGCHLSLSHTQLVFENLSYYGPTMCIKVTKQILLTENSTVSALEMVAEYWVEEG